MPIIDGGGGGSQASLATVRLGSTPTLHTSDIVPFDTILVDTGGYFNATTHLFTIPAGKGGVFLAGLSLNTFNSGAATYMFGTISNSGDDVNVVFGGPVPDGCASGSALLQLAAGDQLTARLFFNGGGTNDVGTNNSCFWLQKMT